MERELRFEAEIKANPGASGGAYIEFPFDTEKIFGRAGRIKVLCFFDGVEYSGSLVKMGSQCHIVGIRKDILASLGKKPGDKVAVRLKEDREERIAPLPEALRQALEAENRMAVYDALSFTKKKELALSIEGAKTESTREKRLAKAVADLEPVAQSPIASYIEGFEGIKRRRLEEIYALIKAEAPEASEKISYGMPTFNLHENLVHFAAQAKHLGFYPSPSGVAAFESDLKPYACSKGAIQFPYDQALPEALIRAILRFRVREAETKKKQAFKTR